MIYTIMTLGVGGASEIINDMLNLHIRSAVLQCMSHLSRDELKSYSQRL